jgi:predicted transcriptional regulator YheO
MITKRSRTRPVQAGTRDRGQVSTAVRAEREKTFDMLRPVVDIVGKIVSNNVEIVLHDLTRPDSSIIKIVNGYVSGRAVGDSILSGPENDKGFVELQRNLTADEGASHLVISDYQTFTRDGRELQSATVIFQDSQRTPFASLCINADMTVVVQAHALLQSMFSRQAEPEPERAVAPGIDLLMEEIISDAVSKFGKKVSAMGKQEKIHAVNTMLQRGLFTVKGGVGRAARVLGVTRFTIYNYLEALRHPDPSEGSAKKAVIRRAGRK